MSEWPEQQRLREALNRKAGEAVVDGEHRETLLSVLQTSASTSGVGTHRGQPFRQWLTPPKIAVAAALLLLLGVSINLSFWDSSDHRIQASERGSRSERSQSDSDAPTTLTDPALPELTRETLCNENDGASTSEWVITTEVDGEMVGVPVGSRTKHGYAMTAVHFVSLGGGTRWADGHHLNLGDAPPEVGASFELPLMASSARAKAVTDRLAEESCAALYMVIQDDVVDYGDELACQAPRTVQFYRGIVRIGDVSPPSSPCQGSSPTLIVGNDILGELEKWAAAYGCSGTETAGHPRAEATVVTFDDCRLPLVLLELDAPLEQAWTNAELTNVVVDEALALR